MKKNEILLRSISEIDDDLIAEASVVKKAAIFDFRKIKKIGTAAAALFLVIASSLIISNLFSDQIKGDASGGNTAPEFDYSNGPEGSEDSPGESEEDSTEEENNEDEEDREKDPQEE